MTFVRGWKLLINRKVCETLYIPLDRTDDIFFFSCFKWIFHVFCNHMDLRAIYCERSLSKYAFRKPHTENWKWHKVGYTRADINYEERITSAQHLFSFVKATIIKGNRESKLNNEFCITNPYFFSRSFLRVFNMRYISLHIDIELDFI